MIQKIGKIVLWLLLALIVWALLPLFWFQKKYNPNPLPHLVKKGAFHVHSTFSDGSEDWETISREAAQNKLDFVVMTDHGNPNRDSSRSTGWKNQVLMVGGSELSLHSGHLAASGYRVPDYKFPPEPREALAEINRDGGATFAAHPFDRKIPWRDWQAEGFTGIEVLSLYQEVRNISPAAFLTFPLRYLLNPQYAVLGLLSYPGKAVKCWDHLNSKAKVYGIFALDAHGKIFLGKGNRSLSFPSYRHLFSILTVYVQLKEEWVEDARACAQEVVCSLREGNFFSAAEALAAANGFKNYFLEPGGRIIPMGGTSTEIQGIMIWSLPFDFPYLLKVYRNGTIWHTYAGDSRCEHRKSVSQPGVYRAEVYIGKGQFRKIPWIMANPIRIGNTLPCAPISPPPIPKKPLTAIPWKCEKNSATRAVLSKTDGLSGETLSTLNFQLHPDPSGSPDFWAAITWRKQQNFSGFQGITFEARASRPMRFWFQARCGEPSSESSFQHSLLLEKEWKAFFLRFDQLYPLAGPESRLNLSTIHGLFLLIDNGNSPPRFEGWAEWKYFSLF